MITQRDSGLLVQQRWQLDAQKRAPSVVLPESWYGDWGEAPPPAVTAEPNLYYLSEAVNAAVKEYANKISATALELFQQRGDKLIEVAQHPGLRLLENPNPFLTRTHLFWHVASDLKLAGNAYWFLAGPQRGAPDEIWRMVPQKVRLVRDKKRYIAGYVYEVDNVLVPLDVSEVIHFRNPGPLGDGLYGLGDLAAAALPAQTGRSMAEWNRNMFGQNFAVPAGIVSTEMNIPDTEWDRFKDQWRQSYGGGARRTAFVRGGKVQFEAAGLSQTDVDFLNGAKWEAEKVYRVFGTYHLLPAQYADDRKVNERMFLENHAWPFMLYAGEMLSDQFFSFWGPREGEGRLIAQFEDIRPRERALDLEEQKDESQGLTFNEWREKRGLEPLDGGDKVLYVHVVQGEKIKLELDALPQPVTPPQLAPFTGQQEPPKNQPPQPDGDQPEQPQDAQENAEERESANNETGDKIGQRADKAAALKSSIGAPDGTVVLYLSHIEDLLIIQQVLQRDYLSDAPIRWTPIEHLHITMVHSALIDDVPFLEVLEAVQPLFHGFALHISGIGSFEGTGEARPIIAFVEPTDELRAFQSTLYAEFARRGVTLSAYSAPAAWTPHITLGYLPAGAEFGEMTYEANLAATSLAFTRGDYEAMGVIGVPFPDAMTFPVDAAPELTKCHRELAAWQKFVVRRLKGKADADRHFGPDALPTWLATVVQHGLDLCQSEYAVKAFFESVHTAIDDPATFEEHALYRAEKAVQATRLDFENDFEDLLIAARGSDVNRRGFSNRLRTLLRKYGQQVYRDGLIDGGIEDGEMDDEDRGRLNVLLADQSQYVSAFGSRLYSSGISDDQAVNKPAQWWNRSIMPIYQAARLSADANSLHEWLLGKTEEHCKTCLAASGQIHRLKDWHRRGVVPNGDLLICGDGGLCDCKIQKTRGRARGRLDAIPIKTGKD